MDIRLGGAQRGPPAVVSGHLQAESRFALRFSASLPLTSEAMQLPPHGRSVAVCVSRRTIP
jgi:hypothetical protein